MAADDFQISVEGLHYERQKLSALVFDPLQEIKDFVARNLRSDEVDDIVECLRNVIRSDTLRTVTDGEALIAVLNLYYGKDNLRVLQRLLKKINCYDLLQILNDWNASNNPVSTRVFRECGYFPLWIRIKNNFTWFSGNKKTILQNFRRLFSIPEITPGDPDYETLIYMGVSFGKTDLLIYVLAPLCTCKYIRTSLGRNDVCLAFEQMNISGVYFARHSERNGFNDDLSATSFTSINESIQGDYIKQGEVSEKLLYPSKSVFGVKNNDLYDGTPEPDRKYFHGVDSTQSSQGEENKDLRVVRASIGYIDDAPSVLNSSSQNNSVEPVRVVRPKLMYLDHSKVPSMDQEDTRKKRTAAEFDQRIVKESTVMVEQSPQNFNNVLQLEKYKAANPGEWQHNSRRVNHFPESEEEEEEEEDLIVPDVKHARRDYQNLPDELTDLAYEDYGRDDVNGNYNDSDRKVGKALHPPSSPKSDAKKLYTSTATLQVNVGKTSATSRGRTVNGEINQSKRVVPLDMSEASFDGEEVSFEKSRAPSKYTQNGDSSWYRYEDATLEDYYKEMIPEPEPGSAQQCYQNEEFYQSEFYQTPEEEAMTPKNYYSKPINGFAQSPLYSPPVGFRDAAPLGSRLVKVQTKFFEAPLQQPSLVHVSTDDEKRSPRYWDLDSDGSHQSSRPAARTENPAACNQDRIEPVFVHPRPFLMKTESKLESEYEDSVFTDTESHGGTMRSRFVTGLPPYQSPPDYNGIADRSTGKFSDDSVSTDTFDRTYKSHLLSAVSVSSICREKEMFLSREELQLSIRGAEDKEIERQMELCKELMVAAKAGDEEELKRTIDEGVDVDYQNEFGQSAMMIASWEGHLGIVETLLNADADPDLQEGFGKSALHEAAIKGHHTIVHRLISAGAKINLTDEEHKTALHCASMRGKRRIVEVLLLFGADVTLLTKYDESAVELAYSYQHNDIVVLLMSSRDKKTRKEMESQIRKQKLRQLSSATSLPNLSKVSSMKNLSRSRSRPDLRKKKSVCPIQ